MSAGLAFAGGFAKGFVDRKKAEREERLIQEEREYLEQMQLKKWDREDSQEAERNRIARWEAMLRYGGAPAGRPKGGSGGGSGGGGDLSAQVEWVNNTFNAGLAESEEDKAAIQQVQVWAESDPRKAKLMREEVTALQERRAQQKLPTQLSSTELLDIARTFNITGGQIPEDYVPFDPDAAYAASVSQEESDAYMASLSPAPADPLIDPVGLGYEKRSAEAQKNGIYNLVLDLAQDDLNKIQEGNGENIGEDFADFNTAVKNFGKEGFANETSMLLDKYAPQVLEYINSSDAMRAAYSGWESAVPSIARRLNQEVPEAPESGYSSVGDVQDAINRGVLGEGDTYILNGNEYTVEFDG